MLRSLLLAFFLVIPFSSLSFAQGAGDVITPVIEETVQPDAAPTQTEPPGETVPEANVAADPVPAAETTTEPEPASPPVTNDPVAAAAAALPAMENIDQIVEITGVEAFRSPVNFSTLNSIFFTKWEHDLLIETRQGTTTRPVIPSEIGDDINFMDDPGGVPASTEPSPREVSLGGIAFVSSKDWTIWLNGTRITPTAIPSTVMDLQVYKDHIDIEWLDRQSNQIYPIRLRTHQKFNLDTRMFLPSDG